MVDVTVADLLRRPVPALLLLLDNIDIGAGEDDIIIRCDITNVGGVFSNSPLCVIILVAPLLVVFAYKKCLMFYCCIL